ncbi:MAG: ABC transporter permease [Hespellia sp.]|nr:ABC transporter permease [Hespellia sp.]
MFFKLVSRNSKRSRKENGLFFASLLISIVAFYMIQSLSHQDVMIFLAKMESDAVSKLLMMIPLFYGLTLIILFFLIYFASKFQMERRRHEFGVYLMMGMRRSRLFLMLLAEDFRSSVTALLIGLPIAVLLSELVSLITARLVGLGIVGHRFSISLTAILMTAAGFLFIKLTAVLILSGKIARQEIGTLLVEAPEVGKKEKPQVVYVAALITGVLLLAAAYGMAISGIAWSSVPRMGMTLLMGLSGTLLFFFGLRSVMGFFAGHMKKGKELQTFTFRQLEEHVIYRSNTLAISSLLILAALCCFAAGVAMVQTHSGSEQHTLDYTFTDHSAEEVSRTLSEYNLESQFSELFDIKIGFVRTEENDYDNSFQMESVMQALRDMPKSRGRDTLLNNLGYEESPYMISLSGYNQILALAKKPAIELKESQATVYIDPEFAIYDMDQLLNQIMKRNPEVQIRGEKYHLTNEVQTLSIVTDRSITLSFALIVPDEVFEDLTGGEYSSYVNGVLNPDKIKGKSLLNAISETNQKLDRTGLVYESYLQNMGRQLFYVVAASYITIYLAIIFLIIANTVIGVQFLTSQQKTGKRYQTLIQLGATYQTVCDSAGRQIRWYFGIPTVVAVISSIVGVRALFSGLLSPGTQGSIPTMMLISVAMILLLGVVEYIYIKAVKKASNRNILKLMVPEREE